MTGPDRIWINEKWEAYLRPTSDGDTSGYIRRDPAVLAALPEVQALIETAQWARNRLERIADDCWHGDGRDLKRSIIGIFADFDAALMACGSVMPDEIRALTPDDATAALAARDAAMIARGMREAATLLREQGYGTAPKQILARAEQIERDATNGG